jgi:hypothetical protein
MILWGIISTCTAAAQNYAGLVVIRFFLGFVEAAYFVRCPSSSGRVIFLTLFAYLVARMPLLPQCLVY